MMRKAASLILSFFLVILLAVPVLAAEEKSEPAYGGKPGDLFPPFELENPVEGKKYSSVELFGKGKDTAVIFMQTACSLCKDEIDMFNGEWANLKDKIQVVLLSVDFDPGRIKVYMKNYNYPFPILHDEGAKMLSKAGFNATPALVVIGPDGRVKQSISGFDVGEVRVYVKKTARGK